MNETPKPDGDSLRILEDLGATLRFIAARCTYLIRHPDGRPGQELELDAKAHEVEGKIHGALADLFARTERRSHAQWHERVALLEHTPSSISVSCVLPTDDELEGPGAALLRYLAVRWERRREPTGTFVLTFVLEGQRLAECAPGI